MDGYINFLAAKLFAEVSAMNAENMQRQTLGQSMAYVEDSYYDLTDHYQKLIDEYNHECSKRGVYKLQKEIKMEL